MIVRFSIVYSQDIEALSVALSLSEIIDSSDVKLSKRLSYLLRHGAVKEGLSIRSDGFVSVDELLSKSLQGYHLEDIKRVVRNSEKQRFTFVLDNSRNWLIKANQGHSIAHINALSLKLLDYVEFDIIHGTYFKYWKKIKKEGLSRMQRNHVHFAKGLNFVCGLRKSAEVFIYIDFEKAKQDGLTFFESENGVILSPGNANGYIEPKYFLKVCTKTGQMLDLC